MIVAKNLVFVPPSLAVLSPRADITEGWMDLMSRWGEGGLAIALALWTARSYLILLLWYCTIGRLYSCIGSASPILLHIDWLFLLAVSTGK